MIWSAVDIDCDAHFSPHKLPLGSMRWWRKFYPSLYQCKQFKLNHRRLELCEGARNYRRYTGFNLNSTRPPLTWSPTHSQAFLKIFLANPAGFYLMHCNFVLYQGWHSRSVFDLGLYARALRPLPVIWSGICQTDLNPRVTWARPPQAHAGSW